MASSSNTPCAACKLQRRKCIPGCVFAPYFPQDQASKFASLHRVFGASNVAKLLNDLSPAHREEAVTSLAYEAEARLHDPVYGCIGYISVLQHRLRQIQLDLHNAKVELAAYAGPVAMGSALLNPAAQHFNPMVMNAGHAFYQQNQAPLVANYWGTPAAMGAGGHQPPPPPPGAPASAPVAQLECHPQQQQITQMARTFEQQQQLDVMRYGGGLEGVAGAGTGRGLGGFNQLGGVLAVAGPSTGSWGHSGAGATGMEHTDLSAGFGHAGPSADRGNAGPATGLALAPQQIDNPFRHPQPQAQFQEQQHPQPPQAQQHTLRRFGSEEGMGSSWDGATRGASSS